MLDVKSLLRIKSMVKHVGTQLANIIPIFQFSNFQSLGKCGVKFPVANALRTAFLVLY